MAKRSFGLTRIFITVVGLVSLANACDVSFAAESSVSIESVDTEGGAIVVAKGLPPAALAKAGNFDPRQLSDCLTVRIASAKGDAPPMLGQVVVERDRIVFRPRFEFRPGAMYVAKFDGARLGQKTIHYRFQPAAAPRGAATRVERVYPTQNSLPENQLKFYVHFSAAMSEVKAYDNLRLKRLDEKSNTWQDIDYPFLKLEPELWSRDGKRFTLLIDPGRIKQGLKPREDVGPSLELGGSYRLVILPTWRDAQGEPLGKAHTKSFRVVAPDTRQPDPSQWKFTSPPADSKEPLVVQFNEPLDHAMLQHALHPTKADGTKIGGAAIRVSDDGKTWSFTPAQPWSAGRHQLRVLSLLEDLAGNSLARPFEVDQFSTSRPQQVTYIRLPFRVK